MTKPPLPPQNLDAEESVLGAMMMNKNAITAVSEVVRPVDFYKPSHGIMFQAALDLDAKGEAVDFLTLTAELHNRGELDRVGGKVRVRELATLVPASANAGHYARIVREAAQRRALITAGREIAQLGWEGLGSTGELMDQADRVFAEAASTSGKGGGFESLSSAINSMTDELQEAVDSDKPIFGLRTGFHDLDQMLTGLHPGRLYVLAARPGVGKSLLAQNIAENVTDRQQPAAIFSLEMGASELAARSLSRRTKLDLKKIVTGRLTAEEMKAVHTAASSMASRPLYVEDNASITLAELRARARRMQGKHGLSLLVVDYLQLMLNENGSRDSRERQVAELSRGLKLLAKDLTIPVICISQLNRNVEYRDDKRPTLADLRDSGAVEQDADVVMFIYREETYKKVDPERGGDAELIVAKNRMGESGTIRLLFLGRRQTFATPARPNEGA